MVECELSVVLTQLGIAWGQNRLRELRLMYIYIENE